MMNRDEGGQPSDFIGGHRSYEGGHKDHRGDPPSPPPLGKTLSYVKNHFCQILPDSTKDVVVEQSGVPLIEIT